LLKTVKYFLFLSALSSIFTSKIGYTASLMSVSETFYYHAKHKNISSLQQLQDLGYHIDATDESGNSALCKAIIENNHSAFTVLKQMGADTNHECVHKISPQKIADFNQGYLKTNPPVNYTQYAKASTLSSTAKIGIGVGLVAAIGGGLALAGGGGGGGSNSNNESNSEENPDINNDQPTIPVCGPHAFYNGHSCECESGYGNWIQGQGCTPNNCETYTLNKCPPNANCGECQLPGQLKYKIYSCHANYELNSDRSACIHKNPADSGETDPISTELQKGNFLNQINAQSAYDKGYTGYIIQEGNTPSNNQENEKIKIGIWDSTFDINHPDLQANIATRTFADGTTKPYGINTEIGPCASGDTTNCYGIENQQAKGRVVWYDENGNQTILNNNEVTIETIRTALHSKYTHNYDWDKNEEKYNISPVTTSVNSQTNIGDDHGTHVTGIIGATNNGTGIQGVVPNSQLYLATWTNNNYQNIDQYYASHFFSDSNVRVVNASFGTPLLKNNGEKQIKTASEFSNLSSYQKENELSLGEKLAYQNFAKNNIVVVKAVGNDGKGGQNEASRETSIPMIDSFKTNSYNLTNLFIGAIAVDKNNKLTSYSQYCGANAAWCLAAPGGDYTGDYYLLNQELKNKYDNHEITQEEFLEQQIKLHDEWGIYSTVTNDNKHQYITENGTSYGYMTGTSVAAPVITGSVGLLMSAYPHLSSQQVVEILFRTANKNMVGWGETFNSGYYDSTTKTYTPTTVVDSLSTWRDSFGNSYDISKIYGHGMVDLEKAFTPLGDLQTPINNSTDSKISLTNTKLALPRGINSQLTTILPKTIMALDDYNRPFDTKLDNKIQYAQRNTNNFKNTFKSFINPTKIQQAGIDDKLSFAFATSQRDSDLLGLGIFDMNYKMNENMDLKFSYRSDTIHEEQTINQALSNPFMNMKNSYALSQQLKYNDLSFAFGASVGQNAFYETDEEDNNDDDFDNRVNAFDTSIAYQPNKSVTFKMAGGILQEKDALLGMNGTGAFDTQDGITYFTGASIEYKPSLAFTLSANYYYGRSHMTQTGGLLQVNNIISDSFAFDARYQPDKHNTLGIQFSSPLRIRSSDATFNIPVARDLYTDTVYFDKQKVSLKPDAREYDLGFYYLKETDVYDWRTNFTVRFNPDHIQNAKPDYRAIMGLSYKY
jgi:hypothetical protein